jgi:hypothetical protein
MSCNPFDRCILSSDNRSKIVVAENKRRYCGINPLNKKLDLLQVDGCLIPDNDKVKCDFLLLACNEKDKSDKNAYFIELKGTDFLHGIDQLENSIKILSHELNDFSLNARIVVTKIYSPDLRNSKMIRLERFLKQRKGNFIRSEKNLEETI